MFIFFSCVFVLLCCLWRDFLSSVKMESPTRGFIQEELLLCAPAFFSDAVTGRGRCARLAQCFYPSITEVWRLISCSGFGKELSNSFKLVKIFFWHDNIQYTYICMNTILSFYIIIKRICKILFIKMLVLSRVYESRFANFLGLKHLYRSLGPSLHHVRTLSESNPKK